MSHRNSTPFEFLEELEPIWLGNKSLTRPPMQIVSSTETAAAGSLTMRCKVPSEQAPLDIPIEDPAVEATDTTEPPYSTSVQLNTADFKAAMVLAMRVLLGPLCRDQEVIVDACTGQHEAKRPKVEGAESVVNVLTNVSFVENQKGANILAAYSEYVKWYLLKISIYKFLQPQSVGWSKVPMTHAITTMRRFINPSVAAEFSMAPEVRNPIRIQFKGKAYLRFTLPPEFETPLDEWHILASHRAVREACRSLMTCLGPTIAQARQLDEGLKELLHLGAPFLWLQQWLCQNKGTSVCFDSLSQLYPNKPSKSGLDKLKDRWGSRTPFMDCPLPAKLKSPKHDQPVPNKFIVPVQMDPVNCFTKFGHSEFRMHVCKVDSNVQPELILIPDGNEDAVSKRMADKLAAFQKCAGGKAPRGADEAKFNMWAKHAPIVHKYDPTKPLVVLCTGAPGVGKTEMLKRQMKHVMAPAVGSYPGGAYVRAFTSSVIFTRNFSARLGLECYIDVEAEEHEEAPLENRPADIMAAYCTKKRLAMCINSIHKDSNTLDSWRERKGPHLKMLILDEIRSLLQYIATSATLDTCQKRAIHSFRETLHMSQVTFAMDAFLTADDIECIMELCAQNTQFLVISNEARPWKPKITICPSPLNDEDEPETTRPRLDDSVQEDASAPAYMEPILSACAQSRIKRLQLGVGQAPVIGLTDDRSHSTRGQSEFIKEGVRKQSRVERLQLDVEQAPVTGLTGDRSQARGQISEFIQLEVRPGTRTQSTLQAKGHSEERVATKQSHVQATRFVDEAPRIAICSDGKDRIHTMHVGLEVMHCEFAKITGDSTHEEKRTLAEHPRELLEQTPDGLMFNSAAGNGTDVSSVHFDRLFAVWTGVLSAHDFVQLICRCRRVNEIIIFVAVSSQNRNIHSVPRLRERETAHSVLQPGVTSDTALRAITIYERNVHHHTFQDLIAPEEALQFELQRISSVDLTIKDPVDPFTAADMIDESHLQSDARVLAPKHPTCDNGKTVQDLLDAAMKTMGDDQRGRKKGIVLAKQSTPRASALVEMKLRKRKRQDVLPADVLAAQRFENIVASGASAYEDTQISVWVPLTAHFETKKTIPKSARVATLNRVVEGELVRPLVRLESLFVAYDARNSSNVCRQTVRSSDCHTDEILFIQMVLKSSGLDVQKPCDPVTISVDKANAINNLMHVLIRCDGGTEFIPAFTKHMVALKGTCGASSIHSPWNHYEASKKRKGTKRKADTEDLPDQDRVNNDPAKSVQQEWDEVGPKQKIIFAVNTLKEIAHIIGLKVLSTRPSRGSIELSVTFCMTTWFDMFCRLARRAQLYCGAPCDLDRVIWGNDILPSERKAGHDDIRRNALWHAKKALDPIRECFKGRVEEYLPVCKEIVDKEAMSEDMDVCINAYTLLCEAHHLLQPGLESVEDEKQEKILLEAVQFDPETKAFGGILDDSLDRAKAMVATEVAMQFE